MFSFNGISLKGTFQERENLVESVPEKLDGNLLNTSPDSKLFENKYINSKVAMLGQNTNLSGVFDSIPKSIIPNPEDVESPKKKIKKKIIASKSRFQRF